MNGEIREAKVIALRGGQREQRAKERGAALIDRTTRFGNPFKLSPNAGAQERSQCIERYRRWLWAKLNGPQSPEIIAELKTLQGLDLACWCKPLPCHGDVLLKAVEWACNQPERA